MRPRPSRMPGNHPTSPPRRWRIIPRVSGAEVVRFLRVEQNGGFILLAAATLALIVANSPLGGWYEQLSGTRIGPQALHLDLTVAAWVKDGLLTFFFLVVGLELKRELMVGELRDFRRAMLPIFGAVGGMVMPALVFLVVAAGAPGAGRGWAVPVATDIAFALAVLAIAAKALPASLRVFLLTLAIVDDLGAILLIAVLFTSGVALLPLLGSAAAIGLFALLQQLRFRGWWVYWPLGLLAWALLHASGVHATLAGVAIGFAMRVRRDPGEHTPPATLLEHRLQPFSAGVAVPLFAFFASGVTLSLEALRAFVSDRVSWAIIGGLLVGKTVGVLGGALLAFRLTLARLPHGLGWRDLAALSVLTGCGFTVSLLIAELAFAGAAQERAKTAVLLGSLLASVLGALVLRRRARVRQRRVERR